MIHKSDLLALKAKLHNDYHNLKTALHEAIHNGGEVHDLDSFYENLVESGFEAVSQTKIRSTQQSSLAARIEHRRKMREKKTPLLYPRIDRSILKPQPYEN